MNFLDTITDWTALEDQIAQIRKQGFAAAPQEALLGINAMAAPVFNYDDQLIGSIGFVGSVQHIPDIPDPSLVDRLMQLTRDISRALGSTR